MDLDYDFLGVKVLERVWTICGSDNGKTVLIGGSRGNKTHILQIDVETIEVVESYWLPGKYPMSSIIINDSTAIIGTNNGYIVRINLAQKIIEKINQISISGESIKCIVFSNKKELLFAAGSKHIFAVDINKIESLNTQSISFNPWDILLTPDLDILVVAGSKVSLELLSYESEFCKLDSVCYGSENRDMTSLAVFNDYIVSASEGGEVYFWKLINEKLNTPIKIDLNQSMLYELQSVGHYLAFSSSTKGAGFIDLEKNNITYIPNSQEEGKICLREIEGESYILFLSSNKEIGLANLTSGNLEEYIIKKLPEDARHIFLTSNGDIIAASSGGIIISNIKNINKTHSELLFSDSFSINQSNNNILLQDEACGIRILSLDKKETTSLNYLQHGSDWKHYTFSGDVIIRINCFNNIEYSHGGLIKKSKLAGNIKIRGVAILSEIHFVIFVDDNQDMKSYLFYFNKECEKIDSLEIGYSPHGFQFINNEQLCISYINSSSTVNYEKSKIINLKSKVIREFEVGYTFSEENSTFTLEANHCFTLRYNELVCSDITTGDEDTVWSVEHPLLGDYNMLGYNPLLKTVLIADMVNGHILSISAANGDIINSFQLPRGVYDMSMTGEYKYFVWKSKKGDISYSCFPFEDILLND